jgi:TonB family protein
MSTRILLSLLFITATGHAATSAPALVRLISSTDDVSPAIVEGLHSPDALTRATAARLATIRGANGDVLGALRELVAKEADADAAREELRALVLFGNDDDVELAVKNASRFPPRMDGVVADAIARLGAPRALTLYPKYVKPLRRIGDASNFFRLALWQSKDADAVASLASEIVAEGDDRGWCELMDAAGDSDVIGPAALTAALRSNSRAIRLATAKSLADRYCTKPGSFPDGMRAAAIEPPPDGAAPDEVFVHEILRRIAGQKPHELTAPAGSACMYASLLTSQELASVHCDAPRAYDARRSTPVSPPQLTISGFLPPGLSDAVMRDYGCKDSLVGTAKVSVDRAGRVRHFESSVAQSPSRCLDAMSNLIAMSLFDPESTSSSTSDQLIIVKPAGHAPCMDATPMSIASADRALRPGGGVTEPEIAKSVDPDFPKDVAKAMTDKRVWDHYVVIQSTVDAQGCVRQMRLVRQAPYPALNAAAIEALSQWRFRPGTSDGTPAPVTFDVAIHFKL